MIYLTSDLHFGHRNIITYCNRPFQSVEEMDEIMITKYNFIIEQEDEVWFLGDLFFHTKKERVRDIIQNLKGRKHLVLGNHDELSKSFYESAGFITVVNSTELVFNEETYLLEHIPRYDPKIKQFCGHVHEKWRVNATMYNVGVDVHNFYPVKLEKAALALEIPSFEVKL